MPHLVRKIKSANPKEITCGVMRSLIEKESPAVSIIHVTIRDVTKKHYHKKLTEFYYVLKGSIDMELDDTVEHLDKDSLIMISPNTNHKSWKTSSGDAEVLVICCPPWSEKDEILVG
jgi:mannose-6-phosphate isomerase-like protein (cupin superfamily)